MRECALTIGSHTINAPATNIDFEYEFCMDTPSIIRAHIMNPSETTISEAKTENASVTIAAGYKNASGAMVNGNIVSENGMTYTQGKDSRLDITVMEGIPGWGTILSRSWTGPIDATDVINDIISSAGLTSSKIVLGENFSYQRSYSCQNISAGNALKAIAKDTRSTVFIRNGQVCFLSATEGYDTVFDLKPSTGLLSLQEKTLKYPITSLFQYKLGSGSIINLYDPDGRSTALRITKGKHTFTTSGQSYTTITEATQL